MNRRKFITLLGGAAAAWPLTLRAQRPAVPVVGFLGSESLDLYAERLRAFHQGLRETGFVEGRNVALEYRWAEGEYSRFPTLLADENPAGRRRRVKGTQRILESFAQ